MQLLYRSVGIIVLIIFSFCFMSSEKGDIDTRNPGNSFRIAFMPDVHFHDVFASYPQTSFKGFPVSFQGNKQKATIRTMEAQLNSTRSFNENYFAFLAALDDVVKRGIKYIALPGDLSDDGQPVHVSRLTNVLKTYSEKYGLHFFLTTGNHDPVSPFAKAGGKANFLGANGHPQPVFSSNHPFCRNGKKGILQNSKLEYNPIVCTEKIKNLGYKKIFELLRPYGMFPKKKDIHYETPFASYDKIKNNYDIRKQAFDIPNRQYEICHEGSGGKFKENNFTNCTNVTDASYLIEPIEGIWLLAIDANVYVPKKSGKGEFKSPSDAGYNKVVTHKKHLLKWIEDVASRAEKKNKKLITFSHYPAADFYNDAQSRIAKLWGKNKFQLERLPHESTSNLLARKGIQLHVAGHMHMNSTAVVKDSISGNVLTNIQVPSLAGYKPGYKIIRTSLNTEKIEVETIVLENVPGFDTFFPLYEKEWNYLDSLNYEGIWDHRILDSSDYNEFVNWHIEELSRLRFIPEEWPEKVQTLLEGLSGRDMLIACFLESSLSFKKYRTWMQGSEGNLGQITSGFSKDWQRAKKKAFDFAKKAGLSFKEFNEWNGQDLSADFYRLRNAGDLAFDDISEQRVEQYALLSKALSKETKSNNQQRLDEFDDQFRKKIKIVFDVMHLFATRLPNNNFEVNINTGDIKDLEKSQYKQLW